jgi:hypothetical protein
LDGTTLAPDWAAADSAELGAMPATATEPAAASASAMTKTVIFIFPSLLFPLCAKNRRRISGQKVPVNQ